MVKKIKRRRHCHTCGIKLPKHRAMLICDQCQAKLSPVKWAAR